MSNSQNYEAKKVNNNFEQNVDKYKIKKQVSSTLSTPKQIGKHCTWQC